MVSTWGFILRGYKNRGFLVSMVRTAGYLDSEAIICRIVETSKAHQSGSCESRDGERRRQDSKQPHLVCWRT